MFRKKLVHVLPLLVVIAAGSAELRAEVSRAGEKSPNQFIVSITKKQQQKKDNGLTAFLWRSARNMGAGFVKIIIMGCNQNQSIVAKKKGRAAPLLVRMNTKNEVQISSGLKPYRQFFHSGFFSYFRACNTHSETSCGTLENFVRGEAINSQLNQKWSTRIMPYVLQSMDKIIFHQRSPLAESIVRLSADLEIKFVALLAPYAYQRILNNQSNSHNGAGIISYQSPCSQRSRTAIKYHFTIDLARPVALLTHGSAKRTSHGAMGSRSTLSSYRS